MLAADDQRDVLFTGDGIMQAIREYILSVITAGLLCAIVGKLLNDKGVPATIGKLLTGIIMMISVLAPFAELSADSVLDLKTEYQTISLDAVQRGEKITQPVIARERSDRGNPPDISEAYGDCHTSLRTGSQ